MLPLVLRLFELRNFESGLVWRVVFVVAVLVVMGVDLNDIGCLRDFDTGLGPVDYLR